MNSNIVTNTGGMCVVDGTCKAALPPGIQSPECQDCITQLRASLISATAGGCGCLVGKHNLLQGESTGCVHAAPPPGHLHWRPLTPCPCRPWRPRTLCPCRAASCVISHFLMGVIGNLPLAVAPAMGLNAYL